MTHRIAIAALIVLASISAGSARAATLAVPGDYASVTAALSAAQTGDVVEVGAGTFAPSTTGDSFPLLVGDGVSLIGAGQGVSVLDAESTGSVIRIVGLGTAIVRDFTLTGGSAQRGGGVQIEGGSPEIAGNLIWQNGALKRGSGINVEGTATPWIHHNVIWENYDLDLDEGGDPHGIQCGIDSAGLVEHNLVGRTDSNGLFTQESAAPTIRHNIFMENGIEGWRGRGICNFGGPATLIHHNLFFDNVISALVMRDESGTIRNVSATEADALFSDDGVYSNLDGDPLLRDPSSLDFALLAGSPAIDAGDPSLGLEPDGTLYDLGPFSTSSATPAPASMRTAVELVGARPNPFNPATEIVFRLAAAERVELRLVDARGRSVRTLSEQSFAAGEHAVRWDGTDDGGRAVASGVYLVLIRTTRGLASEPVVLVR